MTWQVAAMVALGLTLLGGFAWYERSRPPSQIVALVAALAAISVAGRVAFSPIPNVVPTTDITLIAGFALGGAPGFAVGALSGLVSNFWLGQGPWTPWQMAGWGMTGLLGAGLATLTRRHVSRFGLAAVCAFAGFAYGALLDFSLMVTYGGEQSLDRFLAISARGVPFNIAHAAGNAALALVAGPAMVRMLLRYRRRFEFAWKRAPVVAGTGGAAAGIVCLIVALLIAGTVALPGQRADAAGGGAGAGAAWLRTAQNDDGGFGVAPGVDSSPAMTGWAVLGLEAAGINPLDLDHGDATPISYLAGNVGEITTTGDIERTILVLRGAGLDPRHFRGHDLVERPPGEARQGRLLGRAGEPDRVRDLRPAGRRHDQGQWALGGVAAGAPELGWRLGILRRCEQRRGHHRRGAAGPGRVRQHRRDQERDLVPARRPATRRRVPAERRGDQRAVHRLGGPGPGRGGRRPLGGPQGRSLPARLPRPPSRPPMATTATRPRATRRRSGSPPRPCWRPTAPPSR